MQDGEIVFGYPGVSIGFNALAKSVCVSAKSIEGVSRIDVYVNHKLAKTLTLRVVPQRYSLVNYSLPKKMQINLVGRSETQQGVSALSCVDIDQGELLPAPVPLENKLLFIGDSVTCGALIHRSKKASLSPRLSDPYHSYAMKLGRALNAQTHLIAFGGRGVLRSSHGTSDDLQGLQLFERTIPSPKFTQLWQNHLYQPQVVFVSLATNDFYQGAPDPSAFIAAYEALLQRVMTVHPDAQIVITEGAMLNDADPLKPHRSLAKQHLQTVVKKLDSNKVRYLESRHYPGDSSDPHPTQAQHASIASDFLAPIQQLLLKV